MARHSKIDGDAEFNHPHVKGETRPNVIKQNLDVIKAKEDQERNRVIRERNAK